MQTFDAIVLGLGTMGSFTCLELARRGLRVAGFDAFSPPHARGSHSGDTRVFRVAYAEHPDYVPLARRAGSLWDQYGAEFGKGLLTRAGMLSVGPTNGAFLDGIRNSARIHELDIEELSLDDIERRYPAFAVPEFRKSCRLAGRAGLHRRSAASRRTPRRHNVPGHTGRAVDAAWIGNRCRDRAPDCRGRASGDHCRRGGKCASAGRKTPSYDRTQDADLD